MSPEIHTSEPVVNDKDSYFGDPNRSGASHGEAIFGDKHKQFEDTTTSSVELSRDAAVADIVEKYANTDDLKEAATRAAGILAVHQAAEAGNWDDQKINMVKKERNLL